MSRGRRIPPPAGIEAISRLEEIEEIASEFEQRNGYAPGLLSYWDPKPAFEATVEAWVSQGATARTSLVQYAFSSYLTKEDRLFTRLRAAIDDLIEREGVKYTALHRLLGSAGVGKFAKGDTGADRNGNWRHDEPSPTSATRGH